MSSPATLLSIVCGGLQDSRIFTTRGQPNINNYVKVLKKTTRWAAQWVRVDFDGQPNFGQRFTCTIPRKGDLLTQVTLVTTMPDIATIQRKAVEESFPGSFIGPKFGWTNSLGHSMINLIELDIGGVNVDRMDGRLLEIKDELYESNLTIGPKNRLIQRVSTGFGGGSIGLPSAIKAIIPDESFNSISINPPDNPTKPLITPKQIETIIYDGQKLTFNTDPTVCYVKLPFWFSRGLANALPVDALATDQVQISVTLRPLTQLYYTNARIDERTVGFRPNIDISGAMYPLLNSPFYRTNRYAETKVWSVDPSQQLSGISGEIIPDIRMPSNLSLGDTYLLCEYISLEDAEAIALRSASLDYRVNQHYIVPPQNTQGAPSIRLNLPYSNLVEDLSWVFQRPDVANYNAWLLFTRELYSGTVDPSKWWLIPWWPDAIVTDSKQTLPAFRHAYSEPMDSAQLTYGSMIRFNHNASFLRSVLPLFHYRKTPLYNRYIYVYPFGLAPGADDDSSLGSVVNPRGCANWDKLPKKELLITMKKNTESAYNDLIIYSYITVWNVFRVFGGRGAMLFSY